MPQLRDYTNQGGLSRAAIFNAVEASLKRLDTPYIDLLQIHRFDPETPVAETMEALHDLVKSGKVRYIGASSMWATEFAEMQFVAEQRGWTKFVSMQNHYNLLYREEEREMNRFCDRTGVGLIPVCISLFPPTSHHHSVRISMCMCGSVWMDGLELTTSHSGRPSAAATSRVRHPRLGRRSGPRARRSRAAARRVTARATGRQSSVLRSSRRSMGGA